MLKSHIILLVKVKNNKNEKIRRFTKVDFIINFIDISKFKYHIIKIKIYVLKQMSKKK
jgi:hypothetical protein